MRLRRRSEPAAAPASPAPADAPPPGAPICVYAALSPQRLTIAIEERPGSIALRGTEGVVIDSVARLEDDQPGFCTAILDLETAGATVTTLGAGDLDVVLLPPGGAPQPLWSRPLPAARPTPTADGSAEWLLARADSGLLRLTCSPREALPELSRVATDDGAVVLELSQVDTDTDTQLALVTDDDEVLLRVPIEVEDDRSSATLGATDGLPADGSLVRVLVGDGTSWRAVRRRYDDLPRPGVGVPLPEVDDQHGTTRIKLRWSPDGLLLARLVQPADPGAAR